MRVIEPPKSIRIPVFVAWDADGVRSYRRDTAQYVERVRAWIHERNDGKTRNALLGQEVAFPIADGYAQYLVASVRPMTLVHLPLGDLYRLPAYAERGLREADVRANVRMQRGLRSMFAEARA